MDPLLVQNIDKEKLQEATESQLQKLSISNFKNAYSFELAWGQKQRFSIARAFCLKPHVLLLDKLTASLDPKNTATLITILKKLAKDGLTIVVSSQHMAFVRDTFDRVNYIDDGKIIEDCDGCK